MENKKKEIKKGEIKIDSPVVEQVMESPKEELQEEIKVEEPKMESPKEEIKEEIKVEEKKEETPKIILKKASYGRDSIQVDVTKILQDMENLGTGKKISNSIFKGDPVPKRYKILVLEFEKDGKEETRILIENEKIEF
jgi:hypothetical protein